MAGNASNWYKAASGPMVGQAVYVPNSKSYGNRTAVQQLVNAGAVSSQPPRGVAQKALPVTPYSSAVRPYSGASFSFTGGQKQGNLAVVTAPNGNQLIVHASSGRILVSSSQSSAQMVALMKQMNGQSGFNTPGPSQFTPQQKAIVAAAQQQAGPVPARPTPAPAPTPQAAAPVAAAAPTPAPTPTVAPPPAQAAPSAATPSPSSVNPAGYVVGGQHPYYRNQSMPITAVQHGLAVIQTPTGAVVLGPTGQSLGFYRSPAAAAQAMVHMANPNGTVNQVIRRSPNGAFATVVNPAGGFTLLGPQGQTISQHNSQGAATAALNKANNAANMTPAQLAAAQQAKAQTAAANKAAKASVANLTVTPPAQAATYDAANPVTKNTLNSQTFTKRIDGAVSEVDRLVKSSGTTYTSSLQSYAVNAGGSRGDSVMSAIARANGFDGKPDVMSKAQFAAYAKANKLQQLVRGFGEGTSTANKDAFKSGDYFTAGTNGRMWGAGTYTAEASKAGVGTAKVYAQGGQIMRMAIKPNARIIDDSTLTSQHRQWVAQERANLAGSNVSSTEYTRRSTFIDMVDHDKGYFGSMMGYDGLRTGKNTYSSRIRGPKHENFIIWNRTALIVQDEYE